MPMGPWALGLENIHSNVGLNTHWESGIYSKLWGCFFANFILLKCYLGSRGHTITLSFMTSLNGVWDLGGNGWGIRGIMGGE